MDAPRPRRPSAAQAGVARRTLDLARGPQGRGFCRPGHARPVDPDPLLQDRSGPANELFLTAALGPGGDPRAPSSSACGFAHARLRRPREPERGDAAAAHAGDRARRTLNRAPSSACRGSAVPFFLGIALSFPLLDLSDPGRPDRVSLLGRSRHPDPDLRDARLGPEHRRRPRRPARPRLRRLLRRRRLCLRAALRPPSACRSGSACRSPASSPRSGASSSASRCCGCAATISPS